ncbi:pyruvate formate lyase family protein [Vulcanisaeta sp. JCM 14467]|uniref:pyruvate formate lyase family protein n=1 Tax=Vulcanisaeta sp. JCM 14467 TaxID=1295370 RepID=UPI0006D21B9E|nr:pyruvate formate lyase family protein [Vulcanisaeta sp. JCM 14467]
MRKEWEKAGLLGEPLKEKRETFLAAMQTTYDLLAPVVPMQGHTIIGLKKVLQLGFNGIIEQARRQLEKFKRDFEEGRISKEAYEKAEDFLRAVEVSAQAVIEFAERYAKLAEEMASKADGERRKVLLEIAERMRRVPANPPRNFIEALQAVWFTQVAIAIAHAGNQLIIGPGS